MSQHYFIGIPIPSLLYGYAQDVIDRHQLSNHYRVVPHHEDLHITLSFLGSLQDEQLPALTKQLSEISLRHRQLELAVNGTDHFGSSKQPRVIYLSVEKNNQLQVLQNEVAKMAASLLHTEISAKPYIPHVTVAKKLREGHTISFSNETRPPFKFSLASFSLYRIHPHLTPKYEAIEIFHLSKNNNIFTISHE